MSTSSSQKVFLSKFKWNKNEIFFNIHLLYFCTGLLPKLPQHEELTTWFEYVYDTAKPGFVQGYKACPPPCTTLTASGMNLCINVLVEDDFYCIGKQVSITANYVCHIFKYPLMNKLINQKDHFTLSHKFHT